MGKIINSNKKEKRRRWKHPLIAKIKSWFSTIVNNLNKLLVKPKPKINEEKVTFIEGLIRINTKVNKQTASAKNKKELVPFKMYKARDLLKQLQDQKETIGKNDYRRNKNIN